jgi:hypothetical protein
VKNLTKVPATSPRDRFSRSGGSNLTVATDFYLPLRERGTRG